MEMKNYSEITEWQIHLECVYTAHFTRNGIPKPEYTYYSFNRFQSIQMYCICTAHLEIKLKYDHHMEKYGVCGIIINNPHCYNLKIFFKFHSIIVIKA